MHERILVTGGTSVLGGALQALIDRGEFPGRQFFFPSSKECDLLDNHAVAAYIRNHKPDAVLHFAAFSGGVQFHQNRRATILRDNVAMNFNVAEAARLGGVRKVVMTLTTIMYSPDAPKPLKEEYMHNGYPPDSHYTYAFAKRLIDPMIRAYREEYGFEMIGLIPNVIIGERSNFNPEGSAVAAALIRRFYENRTGKDPLVVWGDGSAEREFTYGEDAARAFMWCLDSYHDTQCIHIGTTEATSIKQLAHWIAEFIGVDANRIVFDATKPGGVSKIPTDNSKFVNLSHFKYTSSREAIRKVAEYFAANYPDAGKLRL